MADFSDPAVIQNAFNTQLPKFLSIHPDRAKAAGGKSFRLVVDGVGAWRLDTKVPSCVAVDATDDAKVDCAIKTSAKTLGVLMADSKKAMSLLMSGKITVTGDLFAVAKLVPLLDAVK